MPHLLHRSAANEIHRQQIMCSGRDDTDGRSKVGVHLAKDSGEVPLVSLAAASQLMALLQQAAIDLGEISDAIRACPEFQVLVLRTSEPLALSLGTRVASIEDAVVILGKDQLYTLVETWSGGRSTPAIVPKTL
jgi:hypothetical protein